MSKAFRCDGCKFYFEGVAGERWEQHLELESEVLRATVSVELKPDKDLCEECAPKQMLKILGDYVDEKRAGSRPPENGDVEWLQPWEAADILGMSPGNVRHYADQGKIDFSRTGPGKIRPKRRYSRASVLAFKESREGEE